MKTDFASTLNNLRREHNLSQKKAADDLGISQALLSHYENGIREPKMEFIIKACQYYGVSTDYMLGRTKEKSFDDKTVLKCSDDEQQCLVDAASLIISILAEVGDEQLRVSAAKYISFSIYHVVSALSDPVKRYEPLFDAALKTAEAEFMRNLRRVQANPAMAEKLSAETLRKKLPEQFEAFGFLEESIRQAIANMTF